MKLKLLFALLVITVSNAQIQVGTDIDGDTPGDNFGYAVALSRDGTTMAVSAPQSNSNGKHSGFVRVFSKSSGSWTQLGQDIKGDMNDNLGHKVTLSSDGSVLAISVPNISQVRIFKYTGGIWQKVGKDIHDPNFSFGISIALSDDGSTIAIGNDNFIFTIPPVVYKNIAADWIKIASFSVSDIPNDQTAGTLGFSVSLSADGSVFAFSDIRSSEGFVVVFKYNTGTWTKIGNTLYGKSYSDEFGFRTALSADGTVLAISSRSGDGGNGYGSGYVKIYKNTANNWVQIGNDIAGEFSNDNCGSGISMSANGEVIAIGSSGTDVNGTNSGSVSIYQNIGGTWIQQGQSIHGTTEYGYAGWAIALSATGADLVMGIGENTVAAKASDTPLGNVVTNVYDTKRKGSGSGYVQVYDLKSILSSDSFVLENFNIYPNPTADILNIELDKALTLEKVIIYNTNGQLVKKSSEKTIDLSSLAKGIYNVQVLTNLGKATKKVIVK